MDKLEKRIRACYLDRLDDASWDAEGPRLDFGPAALPYFVAAFEKEKIPSRRARLIRTIWQFRDPAALPALAAALRDKAGEVWKEALDGLVTIGGTESLAILKEAALKIAGKMTQEEKLEWIDEAMAQVADGIFD